MEELNELNKQYDRMIERKLFVENTALSFFCTFTPLGNYRKRKLLKLINRDIEELKEEIERLNLERFSILIHQHDSYSYVMRIMNE